VDGVEFWAAVLAVSSFAQAGKMQIRLESTAVPNEARPAAISDNAEEGNRLVGITINKRVFGSETIPLNATNTAIRTEPDPQKTAEAEALTRILYTSGKTVYTEAAFVPPLESDTFRTSKFGDRRVYRYASGGTSAAVHAGIDFRAATGTPVKAAARGRVVMARFRISTGYTVVIEHLPAVYSLYYHLDSVNVDEGGIIDAGDILGFSGSTGLATGPHLHWEMRAAAENADPDAFTRAAILDRDKIRAAFGMWGNREF
jgi:murein DD-endopeptidase MepM/ murein hydrolase activator NlpD